MNWLALTSVLRTLRRHYGKGGGRSAGLCLGPAGRRTPTAAQWRCYKPAARESYSRWRLLSSGAGGSIRRRLARLLADELHAELVKLTSAIPQDRLAAKSLEIQIQTMLRSYSDSIHRLLTPISFR